MDSGHSYEPPRVPVLCQSSCIHYSKSSVVFHRVPTVMEKHGKKILSWKVMENGQKKVMEIKKYPEKSWNFFTADHESRTRSSD